MIRCKVLKSCPRVADSDCRSYWPTYTLELRVDDGSPIRLEGQHYVTVDETGRVRVRDGDGEKQGFPRVTELGTGTYGIETPTEILLIVGEEGKEEAIELAIIGAADSIEYCKPVI